MVDRCERPNCPGNFRVELNSFSRRMTPATGACQIQGHAQPQILSGLEDGRLELPNQIEAWHGLEGVLLWPCQ